MPVNASPTPKPSAESHARPAASLQASMAESCRCTREINDGLTQYRELLEKVAASPFVVHMRHLRSSVIG
jgi:hypothetical protein